MTPRTADKALKLSISCPANIVASIDAHVGTGGNRSSFFSDAARAALQRAGVNVDDPVAMELLRTRELIAEHGLETVREKHDELLKATLTEAGGGR